MSTLRQNKTTKIAHFLGERYLSLPGRSEIAKKPYRIALDVEIGDTESVQGWGWLFSGAICWLCSKTSLADAVKHTVAKFTGVALCRWDSYTRQGRGSAASLRASPPPALHHKKARSSASPAPPASRRNSVRIAKRLTCAANVPGEISHKTWMAQAVTKACWLIG